MVVEKFIFHSTHMLVLRLRRLVGQLVCQTRVTLRHNTRLLSHERVGAVLQVILTRIANMVEVKPIVDCML